jgi:putative tryptophan/tyrosine transport system substrate-binding protein
MRRREFISLLGSAAAWPVAARAQRPMPVIGFLDPTSPDAFADPYRGFQRGLKETGYIEGDNVTVSYRFAEKQIDRLQYKKINSKAWVDEGHGLQCGRTAIRWTQWDQ